MKWRKIFCGRSEESMIHRLSSEESSICGRCNEARQMSHDFATSRGSPDRSWAAALVLITLFLAPAALTLVAVPAINRSDQPSDEQLMENFLAHEAKFDELVQMLGSDYRSGAPAAAESVDLAGLSAVVTSAARMDEYERLLRQISVADLRYFPADGKLILLPAAAQTNTEGASKSYAYMAGGQPQPIVAHHGYNWRGPGLYLLTGDRRVEGFWFIHYDTTITLAFSPH